MRVSATAEVDQLLREALAQARAAGWAGERYSFTPVGGGTQATVWRGRPAETGLGEVAVRLTPKPAALIGRIGGLVDSVDTVTCPRTFAVTALDDGDRRWTVHVCSWIGEGSARKDDPFRLGQDIARLHEELSRGGRDFTDRTLSFERGPTPGPDQELPGWFVARHLWRHRIYPQFAEHRPGMGIQPIHGDLHWDNVVAVGEGFGFIDFDKLMHAPRAFDLAKLIATGFFRVGRQGDPVRFQQSRAMELLAGYGSVRELTDAEVVAIEAFAVILNEEIARLGHVFDIPDYRAHADAVGDWWTRRHRRNPGDPLGIRANTDRPPPPSSATHQQLTAFPAPDPDPSTTDSR